MIVLLVLLLNSTVAMGHPGHGTTDPSSFNHYMTSPLHVGVAVVFLTLLAGSYGLFSTTHHAKPIDRTLSVTKQ